MPEEETTKKLPVDFLKKALRFMKFAFIFLAVTSVGLLLGVKGLTQKYRQEDNRQHIQRENERLQREIKSLERELTLIRDNPQAIEKIAKRKLGMARAEEKVYIFERGFRSSVSDKNNSIGADRQ